MNKSMQNILFGGLLLFVTSTYAASVDEYMSSAQSHLDKHEVKAAIIQVKNALQKDPNNISARALLGEIYLDNSDPASAEKELTLAIRYGGDKDKLGLLLAKSLLMQGKLDQVLNKIDLGEKASSKSKAELLTLKGNVYLVQEEIEQASKMYEDALTLVNDLPNALLGKARLNILSRELDIAAKQIERALEQDASNVEAWMLRGELMMQREDIDAAQESFSKILEFRPNHVQSKLGMAAIWIKRNEPAKADSQISEILQFIPNHPKAHYLKALVKLQKKDIDGAADSLNSVLRISPNHVSSTYLLGSIHYSKKEYQQAEFLLQKVISVVVDHMMARKILAATYLQLDQPEKVIEILDVIKDKHPDDAQLASLLGAAYTKTGDQKAGVKFLEKAVKLSPDVASVRAQLAVGRLASGNVEMAVNELESAISLDSSLVQAELMLVSIHLKEKQFSEAIKLANGFVEKHPDDPVGYNLLGVSYLGNGDIKLARDSFNRALRVDDGFNMARTSLAMLELQNKNTPRAKEIYKDILQRDKKNIAAMVGLAKLAIVENDFADSVKWLERANEVDNSRVDVAALLVDIYLKTSAPLKAIQVARITVDNAPDMPLSYEVLGRAQMATKEYSSAVITYKKLVELTGGHIKAVIPLAEAYAKSGNLNSAEKVLVEVIKEDAGLIEAHVYLARLQMSQKKFDEALKTAKVLQKSFPKESVGYELTGDVYAQLEKYDDALANYKTASEIGKTSSLVMKVYQVYGKKGKTDIAAKAVEDWLKSTPEDVRARMMLAIGYQTDNIIEKAKEHYKVILQYQPDDVVVLNNMAWMLAEEGNKEAVKYGKKSYELSGQSPAVMDTYGWALVRTGEYGKGINIIKEAILLAPNMPDLRYHLAYAYYKKGDYDVARKEFNRLRRLGFSDEAKLNELDSLLK